MRKGKSITLLSIIGVIIAFVLVMTFVRFPVGIKNYNSLLGAVELDYDLAGGTAYTLTLADDNEEEVDDINQVVDTLEYRLSVLGYNVYSVKAIKSMDEGVEDYQIRIETKTTDTLATDIAVVTAHGELKFFGGAEENPTTEILEDIQVVKSAKYKGEVTAGSFQIDIEFTKAGFNALSELIESEDHYHFKITLGEDEHGHETVLFSDHISQDYFTKRTMPLYTSTESGARQMALQMNSGGLAYKYDVDGGVTVTSPYGEDVALKCAVAVITLAVVLMAVMIVLYKGFGVITALSSLLFILAEGWLLIGVPGIVVSMGGVLGIMCAIVLNAVGMIILAKRVKEEFMNSEKTAKAAVSKGFKTALLPTINVNVISGVFALAFFAFAKGAIKSFAITFGIGAVVAIIATLLFTRMFNALIFPLIKNKDTFLGKREVSASEVEEA